MTTTRRGLRGRSPKVRSQVLGDIAIELPRETPVLRGSSENEEV